MVNSKLIQSVLSVGFTLTIGVMSFLTSATASAENTIDTLDKLEAQRLVLEKQLQVTRLQESLGNNTGNLSAMSDGQDFDLYQNHPLSVEKIVGFGANLSAVIVSDNTKLRVKVGDAAFPGQTVVAIDKDSITVSYEPDNTEIKIWLRS